VAEMKNDTAAVEKRTESGLTRSKQPALPKLSDLTLPEDEYEAVGSSGLRSAGYGADCLRVVVRSINLSCKQPDHCGAAAAEHLVTIRK